MTIARPLITDDDLHGYVDGRLPLERRHEVERWLAEHPEDAARVAFYRRLNEDLRDHFDPVLAEPVPAPMQRPRPVARLGLRSQIAAAVALFVLGGTAGWIVREAQLPTPADEAGSAAPTLARQAAVAHAVYAVEVRHPVEVGIDEEAHLIRWLSNRMGRSIRAPRLEEYGYRLIGGRLLPAAEGGVACQFMYEAAHGQRVTLFYKGVESGPATTEFQFETEPNGVSVFFWREEKLGYALSGNLPREELLRLARAIHAQM